jgi:sodium/proline symporter
VYVLVGVVGRVYLTQPLEGAASETVFMVMVNQIFPSVIAGMLLAAILAATMSTADSQLLVTSSAISGDFYKALFRKNASDKELVWVGRLTVVGVSIIAYLLAINPNSSVFKLVAYAWAGFGAAFGPTIILSLFWKRMTRFGALAGMVGGGLTVLIWKQLQGGLFDLYEIVPGFIISVLAIIIVSLMDKEPAKEIIDEFEAVNVSEI